MRWAASARRRFPRWSTCSAIPIPNSAGRGPALASIGGEAQDAVDPLTQAVNDPDPEVGKLAIRALGQIGSLAGSAVPTLVKELKSSTRREEAERRAAEQRAEPHAVPANPSSGG